MQIDTGCQGGWLDLERSRCSRGRSDMASGKSAASSNGGESEANMRAVGPYLLQRTLGKGQTGERDRTYLPRSIDTVIVCVLWPYFFDVERRIGAFGSSLCHKEDGGRQDDQQGKVE